jgi:hypothetical protein
VKIQVATLLALFVLCQNGHAQGFANLDFESANPTGYPRNSSNVPISAALPGWTAFSIQPSSGTSPSSQIWYDAISLGGAIISVNDANTGFGFAGFGFAPLQGSFSAFLFGGLFQQSVAISQTGLVPGTANSIQMEIGNYGGIGAFTVAVNGQNISMIPLANFPTYTLFVGNISSYANQVSALTITALAVQSGPGPNPVLLDNITFSSQSIPEPSEFALTALGALLLGFCRWRNYFIRR